jgi:hypothetical protein
VEVLVAQFADVTELADFRGRAIGSAEVSRAELFLQLASADIQNYTGQTIELVTDDELVLHPQDSRAELVMPQRPVIEVTAITLDGVAIAGFEVTRWGRVRWGAGGFDSGLYGTAEERYLNPAFPPVVAVTYTHGFDPVPDDVRGVCLAWAARAMENPTSLDSETIGTQYAYTRAASEPGELLLPGERRKLRKYCPSRIFSAPILGRR